MKIMSVSIEGFDLSGFVETIKQAFTVPSSEPESLREMSPYDEIVYGFDYSEFPRQWYKEEEPDIVKTIMEGKLLVFLPFEVSCFEDEILFCVDGTTIDIPKSKREDPDSESLLEIIRDESNVIGFCVLRKDGHLLIESCVHHKTCANNLVPFLKPLESHGFFEGPMTNFLSSFILKPLD